MALLNPSFEDEGALPGEAAHWTLTSVTSLEVIAGFGSVPEEAWENFEGWFPRLATLDDVAIVLAFFDTVTEGYEDFEEGWANVVYLFEMPPAQLVTCPFAGHGVEDCEDGWSNVPHARHWSDVASVTGLFDGEPREDFENQWRSNQAYAWQWASVTASAALFDTGVQAIEDFENAWTAATTL